MKKLILLLTLAISLLADDIVVFNNEYQVLLLEKKVKKLIVGNQDMINISLLDNSSKTSTLLKIFGKKTGNTSILIIYKDNSIENYHVYINENLGFIQKMINLIEPSLKISKVGDGSTVLEGNFKDPHNKARIFNILTSAGLNLEKLMDLTETQRVNKMIRTKLYLVEINNQKAEDLGGVTGLGFFNEYLNIAANPAAINGVTFSGWLLNNAGDFSSKTGNSVTGTLNFLQTKGIAKILDDTVLMTTEDQNASFRVGGEVYIPIGLTQNLGFAPTIQLEEREYGLRLTLTSKFLEKNDFMHLDVRIKDSEFDTNKEHYVQLGQDIFVPSFVSKNIQTNVVVKSGQVIVLGGRLHSEKTNIEEKIPLLGDIPAIGELFKHTVTTNKTSDLLFFLVPEIVDANEAIDETHFYRDFKQESHNFHKNLFDTNQTINMPQKEILQEESVVLMQEPEIIIETQEKPYLPKVELQKEKHYKVNIANIFLRETPLRGKRNQVWSQGHEFIAGDEKTVDGIVCLEVKQDCQNSCKPLEKRLWISKKYTKQI